MKPLPALLTLAIATLQVLAALALGCFPAHGDWRLTWSDEFDGTSVNTNSWTFDTGNGFWVSDPGYWVPGWGNNELEYYTSRPQNVYVAGGLLHVVARRESYSGFHYTSARLKSQGRFTKQYGRFEFRARLPAGLGCWPALWMLPQNPTYGGWPNNGEIDVMENKGGISSQVGGAIHYGGAGGHNVYSSKTYTFPGGDSVTNFHVYALEWTTNTIRWLVDGTLYQTQTNWWSNVGTSTAKHPYPAPFNQPFYLLMNLAIGGRYLGDPSTNDINANTVFPAEMQVDYVRVYDYVAAPPPAPKLEAAISGGGIILAFSTKAGAAYSIRRKYALDQADWEVTATLPGNDAVQRVTNSTSGERAFYSVLAR